ncbi:MAG: stage V sporulation protein AE [Firmicutes bacterium]|nr:stage V sporulation protein AE [Dethiobacter sp.]MBS3889341.1 stage V sporulation protein AE [Bacillota bacterium]MBS4055024.1 stage V sporulation protein AE [Thermaerobacter sp.]
MIFLYAFLVGGAICAIGQLLIDLTPLTPAHVLTVLVVAGGVLSGLGMYGPLVEWSGAGASVPITSFGHQLVQGALQEKATAGLYGVMGGIFDLTSSGITAAIVFGFFCALIFDPKG